MKVQAILLAVAIAAVSAQPAAKAPAKEPVTDKSEPAVRANAREAANYAGQAIYDIGREAKVNVAEPLSENVVKPTARFGGNVGGTVANGAAGVTKSFAAGTLNLGGKTARVVTNSIKGAAEVLDRVTAEPLIGSAAWLHGSAKESYADADADRAAAQEQLQHFSEVAAENAQHASAKVSEAADSVRDKAHEMAHNAKVRKDEAVEDLKRRKEAAEEQARIQREQAAEQMHDVEQRGSSLWEKIKGGARKTQKEAAGSLAQTAHNVGDKLEETEDHAARKEGEHRAAAEAKTGGGAVANAGVATAAIAAFVATAATLL